MSRIIKNCREIERPSKNRHLTDKRNRTGVAPRVESAIYKLIRNQKKHAVLLSGKFVRMCAQKLMQETNKLLREDKKMAPSFLLV